MEEQVVAAAEEEEEEKWKKQQEYYLQESSFEYYVKGSDFKKIILIKLWNQTDKISNYHNSAGCLELLLLKMIQKN